MRSPRRGTRSTSRRRSSRSSARRVTRREVEEEFHQNEAEEKKLKRIMRDAQQKKEKAIEAKTKNRKPYGSMTGARASSQDTRFVNYVEEQ